MGPAHRLNEYQSDADDLERRMAQVTPRSPLARPALMGRYGSARAGAASRDADADTIPLLHGEPSSVSSTRVGDGRHIRWALGVVAMSWLGVLCTLQVFGPHGVLAFVATAPRPGVTLGAAAIPPPKAASSKPAAGGGGHAEPPHDTTTTAPHHAHTTDARAKEGGASNGGQLSVPLVIGDNAVFQRAPESAAVWGWAPPGTTVTVQIIAPSASGDLGEGGGGAAAKAPSDYDDAAPEVLMSNILRLLATQMVNSQITGYSTSADPRARWPQP